MTDASVPILRRKLGARRPAAEIGRMTATKGWRLAFAKAGPEVLEMEIGLQGAEEREGAGLEDIAGLLCEPALLVMTEGPADRFGLVALDPATVSAVIEALTTGTVLAAPPEPRAPTRTDAVLVADFIDRVHEVFETEAGGIEAGRIAGGFRFATPLESARSMLLTLEDRHYRVWRLTLDLGGGRRQGTVTLAYPETGPEASVQGREDWTAALERATAAAEVTLEAVLVRMAMPYRAVAELRAGDVLPLSPEVIGRLFLTGGDGRTVARARLGQAHGMRAVRILDPAEIDDEGPPRPPPVRGLSAPAPDMAGPAPGQDGDAGLPPLAMAMPMDFPPEE